MEFRNSCSSLSCSLQFASHRILVGSDALPPGEAALWSKRRMDAVQSGELEAPVWPDLEEAQSRQLLLELGVTEDLVLHLDSRALPHTLASSLARAHGLPSKQRPSALLDPLQLARCLQSCELDNLSFDVNWLFAILVAQSTQPLDESPAVLQVRDLSTAPSRSHAWRILRVKLSLWPGQCFPSLQVPVITRPLLRNKEAKSATGTIRLSSMCISQACLLMA